MKEQKKIIHVNGNKKRTEIAILISEKKTNFKPKTGTRNFKNSHIIRRAIHHEDIASNNHKYRCTQHQRHLNILSKY